MGSSSTMVVSDCKLTTLLSALPSNSTPFSLEFFPPKTQAGFTNLQSRLTRMATALRPLFVTVTWGAGGSTATKSLELAEICQQQLGLPTVLHLTCTNMSKKLVDEALEECKSVGIRNILALRGDPPRDEYKDEDEQKNTASNGIQEEAEFTWAVDLVRYIRKNHGDFFCVGVAGYPEGHADESHPEVGKQNVDHDLPYLAEKVRAGADFIMTQMTFDTQAFAKYEEKLRNHVDSDGTRNVFSGVPVIPGLMPIQSYKTIKRITKLSHAKLPTDIDQRIEEVKDDDEKVKRVGVDIVSEMVGTLKDLPIQAGYPRNLHFYTLNLEKSVAFILERCNLIPRSVEADSSEDSDVLVQDDNISAGDRAQRSRRASSKNAQPHNRVILDPSYTDSSKVLSVPQPGALIDSSKRHGAADRGSGVPASAPTRAYNLMISEGQGSLGREATWDDFPNGRWGPSHSPAFGEIDGYGPSLKVGPITARRLWGHPKSTQDITTVFKRHVNGDLISVPWSDNVDVEGANTEGAGALRAETETIRKELVRLIEDKGYWTLASQPAVDGARSDDPVFGWGPRGEGFVFQKAFVEFFCQKDEWPSLKQRLQKAGPEEVSWLKIDAQGRFESSATDERDGETYTGDSTSKRKPGHSGVNAVTWGVFKGKEIITPTIIESESFRAWGEEAYSIWGEWRRCFPRGSEEEKCLEGIRQNVILVNVVCQTFVGGHKGAGSRLWKILLDIDIERDDKSNEEGLNGVW